MNNRYAEFRYKVPKNPMGKPSARNIRKQELGKRLMSSSLNKPGGYKATGVGLRRSAGKGTAYSLGKNLPSDPLKLPLLQRPSAQRNLGRAKVNAKIKSAFKFAKSLGK